MTPTPKDRAKGEGCHNLQLMVLNGGKRKYRICLKRKGIFLKEWRCVGVESDECPMNKEPVK